MLNRSKKLNLNTPYQKITNILWEQKRVKAEKENENACLKTKLQFLSKTKNSKSQYEATLRDKYQKFLQKSKRQTQWIKKTNQQIEERNYYQVKIEVMKIENKLNKLTRKALIAEQKLKKWNQMASKIQAKQNQSEYRLTFNINAEKLRYLQQQKSQLQTLLCYKQQECVKNEQQNRKLNQELIELLRIKNLLKNQLKEGHLENQRINQKQDEQKSSKIHNTKQRPEDLLCLDIIQ